MEAETLYLCLDLAPRPGVLIRSLDPNATVPDMLKNEVLQGRAFERNWQVFTDLGKAREYTDTHKTLVLIPIAAEVIPLGEVQ